MTTATHIDASTLLAAWARLRDASRAHRAAIALLDESVRRREEQYPENIRYVALPTFRELAASQFAWWDAAAAARAEREPVPEHAYVAKTGGAYEAVCPAHPRFRRIAWTRPTTPLSSAHEHNAEHHGEARARVYEVPGREISSLLP